MPGLPCCWRGTLRARFLKMWGAVLPLKSTRVRHLNSFKIWPQVTNSNESSLLKRQEQLPLKEINLKQHYVHEDQPN